VSSRVRKVGKGQLPVPGERGGGEADGGEEFGRVEGFSEGAQDRRKFQIPS
jgi:hypothetical protein